MNIKETTLTQKGIEELRIAIAEDQFYRWKPSSEIAYGAVKPIPKWHNKLNKVEQPPPYTTSLDAIQQAALERFKDDVEIDEFNYQLNIIGSNKRPIKEVWQQPPLDWCIAYARTAKIWRWKV